MQQSTAFLIIALVIVKQNGLRAQLISIDSHADQVAEEGKNRAVTIIDGPKYVVPPPPHPPPPLQAAPNTTQPEKPKLNPDKTKPKYAEPPRFYMGPFQNLPPLRNPHPKLKIHHPPNTVFKYHKVVPLPHRQHHNQHSQNQHPQKQHQHPPKQQQLVYAASTAKPSIVNKNPKFSLPVETINGIRSDFVRPPHFFNTTTTTTTTPTPTTTKYLRTKRIWPQHIIDKMNGQNLSSPSPSKTTKSSSNDTKSDGDLYSSQSRTKIIILKDGPTHGPTDQYVSSTRAPYRRVTRVPKKKPTSTTFPQIEQNDWVPIVPSHYPLNKVRNTKQTAVNRRSDVVYDVDQTPIDKRMLYLQSYGLIPVGSPNSNYPYALPSRKNVVYFGNGKKLKKNVYSGSRPKVEHSTHGIGDDTGTNYLTRIKHHHHHHHHRYVKTVDKPIRVEVPKPVPVPVPMPVPVRVEHKVPYPVTVKVPHPVPVKVVETQYVPKPYPVVKHVPVEKIVHIKVPHPVPVPVETKVPYPVRVEVPVPQPYPVRVEVEKKVPYPVPVKVMVPQPYPVETKVPYPVGVREPVEVIKHVPIKVPVPQPYPVKVPQPYPVPYEKKVPYPVHVEKRVPVPMRVIVPKKVEVEKKIPVFVPKPYPIETKVPVPIRVPYPVRVPIKVPVGIPIMIHPTSDNHLESEGITVGQNLHDTHYSYSLNSGEIAATPIPHSSVTFHGNTISPSPGESVTFHGNFLRFGNPFSGFQARADHNIDESTTPYSEWNRSSTVSETVTSYPGSDSTEETTGSTETQTVSNEKKDISTTRDPR